FGSPAIDAGDDCVVNNSCSNPLGFNLTTDQRGITRPQGAHVDIGAFELQVFVVTKTADTNATCLPGNCSLREAINAANAATGGSTIAFAIPGGDSGCDVNGVCTIAPSDADFGNLPAITKPVFTDGYTQSGASPNTLTLSAGDNAVFKIVLDGALVSLNPRGFDLESGSDNSTIRGFVITHWASAGVYINDSSGNTISGNFIGTDVTGLLSGYGGGGNGVQILGLAGAVTGNVIGGDVPATRNVIAGYSSSAIEISGASALGNTVEGNYLGTDR